MKADDEELRAALDAVRAKSARDTDLEARRASDPVGVVHRYEDPLDRELVGLVAAAIAFGNVKTILLKLGDLLDRVGPSPSRAADDPAALKARLRGWKHRVFVGDDLARLLIGARSVQRAHGTLGQYFAAQLDAHRGGARSSDAIRGALAALRDAIRAAGNLRSRTRRGPSHLLPDPLGSSGVKRLLLYLRWMVRPADGIDLGLWPVDPARLLMPVDTHIHKLSRNLGLTGEERLSWRATEIGRASCRERVSKQV